MARLLKVNKTFLVVPLKVFFVSFFLLLYQNSQAQYQITKEVYDKNLILGCIDSIYNYNFDRAETMYSELRKKYPNDPSSYMLEQLCLYWQLVPLTVNNQRFLDYSKAINKTIELSLPLLKDPKTEAEASFYLLASYSSLIIVQSKLKEFGKALGSAKQTYMYIKKGFLLKQNYTDFHYSTGLYNYYVEQFPENHGAVKPFMWFFPKGSKSIGLSEFALGAENGLFSKPQSNFFLIHVYVKYENKPLLAQYWANKMYKMYPNNPLVQTYMAEIALMLNDFDKTLQFANFLTVSKKNSNLMLSEYFKGMIELKKNKDTKLAKAHFYYGLKICLENKYTTSDYYGLLHLGLGLCYELEKNRINADENFKKADDFVEHKWAKNEIKRYFSIKKSKR